MTKRPLAIFLLGVAFLLSAWGNVIAASFCPRYLSHNGCVKRQAQQTIHVVRESCHPEMAGMDMGDMKMDDMQMEGDSDEASEATSVVESSSTIAVTESSVNQFALEVSAETCGTCWMHSQASSGAGTLAVNSSPRSVDATGPSAELTIALGFPGPTRTEPSAHGPPGNSLPRHILINIFRI